MEPLVQLLLELGSRAKLAEAQILERDKKIASLEEQLKKFEAPSAEEKKE